MQGSVREALTRVYGAGLDFSFPQNPELIGGMRIKVGSDVYDGSVQARLAALQESFWNLKKTYEHTIAGN